MLQSARLKQVLAYLEPNLCLADIGCDHAHLAIAYAKKYPSTKVFALDNKREPLQQASKNIEEADMLTRVVPCLSNGLENLNEEVRQITIAGLGGNNIIDILASYPQKLQRIECLVLQANNNVAGLRLYLIQHDFLIVDENLIKENEVIYEIMKVKKGKQALNKQEIMFGPILLGQKNPLFYEKWKAYADYLICVYQKIPAEYSAKRADILAEINLIKLALNEEGF